MGTQFLDKTGLQYFWSLLKTKLAGKQNSLSTAQLNACNSGITSTKVSTYDGYASGKANTSHTHLTTQLSEPSYIAGYQSITMSAKVDYVRANKLIFLPADQIIIEKTTDGGTTWVDAGYSDDQKKALFDGTRRTSIGIPLLNGVKSLLCGLRITITAMKYNVPDGTSETNKYNYWNSTYVKSTERYCSLNDLYFWLNANSDKIGLKVQAANGANSTNWVNQFNDESFLMTGWSGSDYAKLPGNVFGGGTTQTGNYWNYRLTFMTKGGGSGGALSTSYTTATQNIVQIAAYGSNAWVTPNSMMKYDHIYSWDTNRNVTFPAQVKATKFSGPLTGNVTGNCSGSAGSVAWSGVTGKPTFATVATSGSYNDLSNKPSIPTESTVSGWGFTKTSGTITEIKMNGVSKGTGGTVDLGTVITSHQSLAGYVPTSRTVNGKALTSNITIEAEDIGAAHIDHSHDDIYITRDEMRWFSTDESLAGNTPSSGVQRFVNRAEMRWFG